MHIEIGVPAVLPLAFASLSSDRGNKSVLLGIALQHPPTHFFAAKRNTLSVYGPQAHVARAFAQNILKNSETLGPIELKIESTVPSLVGLGSESGIALSTAQAITRLAGEDIDPADAQQAFQLWERLQTGYDDPLTIHAAQNGGVVLVELEGDRPQLLRHKALKHRENEAWAFVLHFPNLPDGTPDSLERDRLNLIKKAAPKLDHESEAIMLDQLWPALEREDIGAFGKALMRLRGLNQQVLQQVGEYPSISEGQQKVYKLFEEEDALAYGESFTGIALFALVHGATPTQLVRKRLLKEIGYHAGSYIASITDNEGVRHKIVEEDLHLHDYPLPNTVDGVSGPRRE